MEIEGGGSAERQRHILRERDKDMQAEKHRGRFKKRNTESCRPLSTGREIKAGTVLTSLNSS